MFTSEDGQHRRSHSTSSPSSFTDADIDMHLRSTRLARIFRTGLAFSRAPLVALVSVSLLAALLTSGPAAAAPTYPKTRVRLVVGFAPGGGNDILARILAQKLQGLMHASFFVDNRPGASGVIAIEVVRQAPPDGYTLLIGPSSGMTMNPILLKNLPYDPRRDFAPISLLGRFPLILSVNPSFPVNSVTDLISLAKSKPGQINYSSAASSFQLATELFAQQAGISLSNVPYKGSGPAVQAVVANEVPMTFGDSAAVIPLITSGRLKALGVSTLTPVAALPGIKPIAQQGVPGFDISLWSALFAPKGTNPEIIDALHKAILEVMAMPDVRAKMETLGIEPVTSTPEQLQAQIVREIDQFTQVAARANIKAQ